MTHWLAVHLGLTNASGGWYLAWSGFVSDIEEVSLIGAALAVWKAHTCHVDGCWRIGRHPAADGQYRLCRVHHPDVPSIGRITPEHVAVAHMEAKA